MSEVHPIRLLAADGIEVLDQTALPGAERRVVIRDLPALCEAIRSLRIRGAPLLGIAGAAGIAIACETRGTDDVSLALAAAEIASVRPTAVELGSLARAALAAVIAEPPEASVRRERAWRFAAELVARRQREDRALADHGARYLADVASVLTHCNTGALATGGIGTALGVVRVAFERGTLRRCYATETRPLLQGARLTMWELQRLGVPATLLPDTAAASLIAAGRVEAVITGADRIAANGDTANKIGTYQLALAARAHGIPFIIAAPTSTFDPRCADGGAIPIEFRPPQEVGGFGEQRWAPAAIDVYNPAFDVTPGALISAFVTERGVVEPPFADAIATLLSADEHGNR